MPTCPFCGEYFLDDSKLMAHINSEHPEQAWTPDDAREVMKSMQAVATITRASQEASTQGLIANVAGYLTNMAIEKNIPKEQLWAIYQYFFQALSRLLKEHITEGREWKS